MCTYNKVMKNTKRRNLKSRFIASTLWIFQYFSDICKNNQHLLYTGVKHEKPGLI